MGQILLSDISSSGNRDGPESTLSSEARARITLTPGTHLTQGVFTFPWQSFGRARAPPFRFQELPAETKRTILEFCDTPSLAAASLVSKDMLEMASPELYRLIVATTRLQVDCLSSKQSGVRTRNFCLCSTD